MPLARATRGGRSYQTDQTFPQPRTLGGGPARGGLSLLTPGILHRLLLRLDPERAHDLALAALRSAQTPAPLRRLLAARFVVESKRLRQDLLGHTFPNPVGLAAGFDKDAGAISGLAALGFGFLEVGTVTPRPQVGNPRPRLFRYPREQTLQNEMGFNNRGMVELGRRLDHAWPAPIPLGVNIGKNRATPAERASDDYATLMARLGASCDFFVVNVSSPNTPGLRDLQSRESLRAILEVGREMTTRPILVKLAPDLALGDAVALGRGAVEAGAAGIVLTNTTTDYGLLPGARPSGGLSGRVLKQRSLEMLRALAGELFGRTILISVGGIESALEVYGRLRAGASLVEIYTALVFQGPALVAAMNRGLLELMDRDGVGNLVEIIGADVRPAS